MSAEPVPPPLYCYNHPDRETYLRCNRCEQPICIDCAVLTPTGYRCKSCVRSQQKVFETAGSKDVVIAALIAVVLAFLGSFVARVMGFFTIFLAPIAGMLIAEAIRWATKRRRSMKMFKVAAAAAAVGALPLFAYALVNSIFLMNISQVSIGYVLPSLLWPGVYIFLVSSTVYARLGGIQIKR